MTPLSDIRARWLKQLQSTAPADRPAAEDGVRRLYAATGFAEPRHFLWFDSPCAAAWPVALLSAPYDDARARLIAPASLSRDDRDKVDRARATLGERLAVVDWTGVVAAVGAPLAQHLQFPPVPERILSAKISLDRFDLVDDVSSLFVVPDENEPLRRAEDRFWGGNRGALHSALHCPTVDQIIATAFVTEYGFSMMAEDEHRVLGRAAPPIMKAAWDVARAAGLWWPFQHAAILTERPTELHFDTRMLLHRGDGPAAVYRDGWKVYAWAGKAVPARWILEPDKIPARDLKHFDADFRKYVESRVGTPAAKSTKRERPGPILEAVLPADAGARLERLRAHNGGTLPLYDRYVSGDYRGAWSELVTRGAAVREDPTAADALAVAYETMRRASENIRTLVERLTSMGYVFTTSPPRQGGGLFTAVSKLRDLLGASAAGGKASSRGHTPPGPDARKDIADFEKQFGALPLSLRTFYEIVGEVNFMGHHPALNPPGGRIAPDPLVVYALDEGAVEYDEEDEDGEASPSAITIAPDDLHKADTSGGDPYEMAIPDLRADGELLNERHQLYFVEYLRLCFRFGGFPGYDGVATVPTELATLSAGLIEL